MGVFISRNFICDVILPDQPIYEIKSGHGAGIDSRASMVTLIIIECIRYVTNTPVVSSDALKK
uniref:Uncharacterized protein n=1 Tax=Physcomitrium patens TaxID=3218 RepID=A0A2K1JHC7_PHYPA|nr:hypothetical protein PHYPA_018360 [Physcomitrium patens]